MPTVTGLEGRRRAGGKAAAAGRVNISVITSNPAGPGVTLASESLARVMIYICECRQWPGPARRVPSLRLSLSEAQPTGRARQARAAAAAPPPPVLRNDNSS